jgi:hypothetical protein
VRSFRRLGQGYTNQGLQVAMAIKFFIVMLNICWSSVWNFFVSCHPSAVENREVAPRIWENLYTPCLGLLKTVARKLTKCSLDLMGVRGIKWEEGGSDPAGVIHFYCAEE